MRIKNDARGEQTMPDIQKCYVESHVVVHVSVENTGCGPNAEGSHIDSPSPEHVVVQC